MQFSDLDAFAQGYVGAAAWTMDEEDQGKGAVFHESAYEEAKKICDAFQARYADLLSQAGSGAYNGHDLWLTRNGHGAGFWDRDYPNHIGEALTDAAYALGETYVYVGDDNFIYFD